MTVTIGDGDFDARDLMLGLDGALLRFKAEANADAEMDPLSRKRARGALFEALGWADSMQQLLTHAPAERGGRPGWDKRLSASDADLLLAIIYARGAVHHQWWAAVALHVIPGHEQADTTSDWLWAKLPANSNRRGKARAGRAAYDRVLHGRPVVDSINAMRAVYSREVTAAHLGPRLYVSVP